MPSAISELKSFLFNQFNRHLFQVNNGKDEDDEDGEEVKKMTINSRRKETESKTLMMMERGLPIGVRCW